MLVNQYHSPRKYTHLVKLPAMFSMQSISKSCQNLYKVTVLFEFQYLSICASTILIFFSTYVYYSKLIILKLSNSFPLLSDNVVNNLILCVTVNQPAELACRCLCLIVGCLAKKG